ncbi:hypothetical protein S40285_03321 [Stachybotrys chlorohalonatus IBT 40285]|uniref:Zn(2)-C6 fungal-type domain-containing protein n=1 Tax=Stachybotrys chlorohalonatus (strain IBT 40285) TaxID=1283841 RepID=A0A084R1K4_STAC4|nr:hypothetical protein S40285_03321 [Stachybotrys chlorohalonata IBT 40285]
MAGCIVIRKRNLQSRPKVKTGCATCRTRKIKCDEHKPFCRRCVGTGRTCDGYDFPLRPFISHHTNKTETSSTPALPTLTEITPKDIDLLNRSFSTKTIFNVKLDCDGEAKRILQASLTNPPIWHAVSSLRALREGLEASGDASALLTLQTPNYVYGLQQYCMALAGLASHLSCPGSDALKLALFCCQIFISIEQIRGNYVAMVQHIIQGFRIMREHRARPILTASQKCFHYQAVCCPLQICRYTIEKHDWGDCVCKCDLTISAACEILALSNDRARHADRAYKDRDIDDCVSQ